MNNATKWLLACAITVLLGLILVASIVIIIDPFFQYHKPLVDFPYVVDDQVDMNPGLARHMDYDAVILGSSMVVNFDTDYISDVLNLNVIKLPYNGAYPKDQSNILSIIFEAKKDTVKQIFLGIDELNYSGGVDETKFPITDYLYDKNLLNDVQYIFNKDVLLDYCIRPIFDAGDKTEWNMIYPFWWKDEHYSKPLVLMYYEPAMQVDVAPLADTYIDAIEQNLDTNILPYIEAHPETTFTIFYPPYSILYWNDINNKKELDVVIEKYRYMSTRLLAYDNVELYFFQNDEDVVCDLNNYADYTHYSPKVCEYMVQCFANGNRRISKDSVTSDAVALQIEEQLSVLYKMASEYDYESIWEDWYN